MTNRQLATYDLIVRNSHLGLKTTQKEIVDNYITTEFRTDGYEWNDNPKSHDHCVAVWADINEINKDNGTELVILWDSKFNYWVAHNYAEIVEFCIKLYWKPAMSKLWRYGNLMRKAKRDNQGHCVENNDIEFWQTFLNERAEEIANFKGE